MIDCWSLTHYLISLIYWLWLWMVHIFKTTGSCRVNLDLYELFFHLLIILNALSLESIKWGNKWSILQSPQGAESQTYVWDRKRFSWHGPLMNNSCYHVFLNLVLCRRKPVFFIIMHSIFYSWILLLRFTDWRAFQLIWRGQWWENQQRWFYNLFEKISIAHSTFFTQIAAKNIVYNRPESTGRGFMRRIYIYVVWKERMASWFFYLLKIAIKH